MNIVFENTDKINALLTVKIEKADYQEQLELSLKSLCRKSQIPGFRKGMAPMAMIRKMYYKSALVEEVNKLLAREIEDYFETNNITTLRKPEQNKEKQPQNDFNTMEDFEFVFNVSVIPDVELELTKDDELDYYTIELTDEMVNQEIWKYTQYNGKYKEVDSYLKEEDLLKGTIVELDEEGNIKEGGIQIENVVIVPAYMKSNDQKAIFDGAKTNDVRVFNPKKAYDGNQEELSLLFQMKEMEVADITSDFSFRIKEISRFAYGEQNQELFDSILGKDVVKSEEEFREKIIESLTSQFTAYVDYKLFIDARKMLVDKIKEPACPEESLKRFIHLHREEGAKDVDERVEKEFLEDLKWSIVKYKLTKLYDLKIESSTELVNTAMETAKAQFAEYGMTLISDRAIEDCALDILKSDKDLNSTAERALDTKLVNLVKEKVTLNPKTVSHKEFFQLISTKAKNEK
ncbi:MAG: trigger factor [Mediterranea sp.]|jgi:trigger factor|nr:trigger factor [Mediterranea sp.]